MATERIIRGVRQGAREMETTHAPCPYRLRPGFLFVAILPELLFPFMLVHFALFALTTARHTNTSIETGLSK